MQQVKDELLDALEAAENAYQAATEGDVQDVRRWINKARRALGTAYNLLDLDEAETVT